MDENNNYTNQADEACAQGFQLVQNMLLTESDQI